LFSNQFESLSYRFEPGRMRGRMPSRSLFFPNPISVTSVASCETGSTDAQILIPFFEQEGTEETEDFVF
jgi:hypothetical protein